MRSAPRSSIVLPLLALTTSALLSACSGGGSGSGEFKIVALNLNEGTIWRINRPIRITFSQPVDFASVNLNTINVRQPNGGPAAGEFYAEDGGTTVVFQPLCPLKDDLSDAGLKAGLNPNNGDQPYDYELNIIGVDKNSVLPVRSVSGAALANSQTRTFTTPVSLNPLNLYFDTKVGPPVARVLGDPNGTEISNATYIEIAGTEKHYFERVGGVLQLNPPLPNGLPLNKLSEAGSQVALVVCFDQAIDATSTNVSSSRLRWEFQDNTGAWRALSTQVTLDSNCGHGGARVRLTPLGLLPPSTQMRATITPEFADIIGEVNAVAQSNFAQADTEAFPSNPPQILQDAFLESFDTTTNQDATATFSNVAIQANAEWQDGTLQPTYAFTGTGGPNGNFDWYIEPGATVVFNTANTSITGYDLTLDTANNVTNYAPIGGQTIVGGVVDVNDFYVDVGAVLKIEGPNPFLLMVSGKAVIRGRVDASGTSSAGVATLNTTMNPEPGAAGQAGGGKGGTGSPLTTASSPKGGNGYGAWNVAEGGGVGGETGWASVASPEDLRRGAGGGGAQLGAYVAAASGTVGTYDQRRIGYDAEKGFDSTATVNGALTGAPGPFGGAIGPSPFVDPIPTNNFFGTKYISDDPATVPFDPLVILGELTKPWAGGGGGGGGDASIVPSGTFPYTWNPQGDEKGAGGGGGGGSVHIMCLGPIEFGANGQLLSRGGLGGGGENSLYLNRVGGGSGGGSGGYVVLQTASIIDFRQKVGVVFTNPNDLTFAIDCRGGEGGAGAQDVGGAIQSTSGQTPMLPLQDACPAGYLTTGANGCRGLVNGAGGDGGPGVIQLHTSGGVAGQPGGANVDIILPSNGATLREICAPPPLCFFPAAANRPEHMIPSFGAKSGAQSKWIALGEGGFDINSPTYRNVVFAFGGTNPATGFVLTDAQGNVTGVAPVLGPTAIDVTGATTPYIVTPGGYQLVMDATPLIGTPNEVLLQNTDLLLHYAVELVEGAGFQRFDVVAAAYDSGTQRLTLTIDGDGPSLISFGPTPTTTASLRPAFFRVASSGTEDYLPASATVQIKLRATTANALGQPNDPAGNTAWVTDPAVLNALPGNNLLRFVKFEVSFDIAAQGGALSPTNPIPSLEFLRIPFKYQ